jgi:hypothetical protein
MIRNLGLHNPYDHSSNKPPSLAFGSPLHCPRCVTPRARPHSSRKIPPPTPQTRDGTTASEAIYQIGAFPDPDAPRDVRMRPVTPATRLVALFAKRPQIPEACLGSALHGTSNTLLTRPPTCPRKLYLNPMPSHPAGHGIGRIVIRSRPPLSVTAQPIASKRRYTRFLGVGGCVEST